MNPNCWLFALLSMMTAHCAAASLPIQRGYLKASNAEAGDRLGYAIAISGETMVVAAITEDSASAGVNGDPTNNAAVDTGAAYVFVHDGTNWVQQAYLKPSNPDPGDEFGYTVAVSGDTIVVGTRMEGSAATGVNGDQLDNSAVRAGAAYVFVRNGTNWSQQAYLKASNAEAYDAFGYAVDVYGDTIVVGARQEASGATGVNGDQTDNSAPGSGAAYVFARDGTNWTQQAYLKASNTGTNDQFGYAVAISGETVLIGAYGESSSSRSVNGEQSDNSAPGSGAAYVFVRNGTNWIQQAYLKSSNADADDLFGSAVSISGDTAVIGAVGEDSAAAGVNSDGSDNSASESGAAYIFVREGTNWIQQAYLKASNPDGGTRFPTGDWFGFKVGISGNVAVVGAAFEDSSAIGVNGDQSDNSAREAGAAYVFGRTDTDWNQTAYLKASNTEPYDSFGYSVSISGYIAVGAPHEDSGSPGVNADQNDNSASAAGAVYVFALAGETDPQAKLEIVSDGSGGYFIRVPVLSSSVYELQRSPILAPEWESIESLNAVAPSLLEFHDTNPPVSQSFYRVIRR